MRCYNELLTVRQSVLFYYKCLADCSPRCTALLSGAVEVQLEVEVEDEQHVEFQLEVEDQIGSSTII